MKKQGRDALLFLLKRMLKDFYQDLAKGVKAKKMF